MFTQLKKNFGLFAVLIVVSLACFFFSYSKEGLFIDEIYSFGLSNSYYAPFIKDLKGENIVDTTMTRQEVLDYISVGAEDSFAYGSVYYNQSRDVHPPLYYWLLHTVCSLAAAISPLWSAQFISALVLDYLIYLLALLILYALVKRLLNSRYAAVAAVALYGLSGIGLSTMLMIRMYVLLTLFTLLLAYSVLCILRRGSSFDYILLFFSILGGFLTQYYFVFYAFFLCGLFVLYALRGKEFKKAALFASIALAAVGIFVLIFPACFEHLFSDDLVSGGNAIENVFALSHYPERILSYAANLAYWIKAIVFVSLLLLIFCVIGRKKIMGLAKESKLMYECVLLLLPALLAFLVIAICSPIIAVRYVYNLAPIFVVFDAVMVYLLLNVWQESFVKIFQPVFLLLIVVFSLYNLYTQPPEHIYSEHSDHNQILREYADSPCVYINDNYNAPITQDLMKLLNFEDFFIAADTASSKMLNYVGDAESIVVFIDTDEFWSSGFDPGLVIEELSLSTGLTHITELYSYRLSNVYLLEDK